MAQRGRQSGASQAVMAAVGLKPRLEPLQRLSKEEQTLWDTIIDSQANGYFTEENRQALLGLVQHSVAFNRLHRLTLRFTDEVLDNPKELAEYKKLLYAISIESRQMLEYHRNLRLVHHTRYNADAAFLQRKKHGVSTVPAHIEEYNTKRAANVKAKQEGGAAVPPPSKPGTKTSKDAPWDH